MRVVLHIVVHALQAFLEAFQTFAEAFAELRQLLAAKEHDHHKADNEQVHGLEQVVEHGSLRGAGAAAHISSCPLSHKPGRLSCRCGRGRQYIFRRAAPVAIA